ncbi:MAG: ATP-binding protein [Lentimicrobium sp.]
MIYNRITLAFPEKEEKLFLDKYFLDSLFQVRVSFIIVSFLYGIFGYLDSLMFPEYADLFHIIRFLIVIPVLLSVFFLSFTRIFRKIWQLLLFLSLIIGGSGISVMIMLVPENYAYYAGMMLIFSAGYFFIRLRFLLASIAGWIILLVYNTGVIFYANTPAVTLINTNFFFISANIIGMFAAYSIEYSARRNFFLNYQLDKEKLLVEYSNKNLEKTVEERTNELLLAKEAAETINANVTAIIEGTQNNIWAFNENYEILYINHVFQREFEKTFGVRLSPGISLIGSLPESLRSLWKSRYDRVLNNEQFTIEDAIDSGKGIVFVEVSFNPIVKKGEVVGGSCFGEDITDRKLSEIELKKALELAEQSDRLKSAFLANMSHEIRTPMNGILGFSELLKNPGLTGDQQQEYISIIEKSGNRMLNIINDIVDISKIEAGLMKLDVKESNINELNEYIYAFFKPEVEAKGIKFSFRNSLPANESVIFTDREKIYAILTNLVKNAIKYTEKGAIEFGYLKKGDFLEFYVKDTGIGVPQNRQEAIFERFIQADIADKMARQGAGLGLSISKAYIEMFGGKIWVESIEEVGSTFYFTLPYNAREKSLIRKDLMDDTTVPDISQEVQGLKILIAEDDETSGKLLEIVAKMVGTIVLKAGTGIEALEAYRNNPDIDLILMDVKMPGLNGYEVTRQIRQLNKEVIIIAQTAYGLAGDREKALNSGCNDYIAKPLTTATLLSIIKKQFRNSERTIDNENV